MLQHPVSRVSHAFSGCNQPRSKDSAKRKLFPSSFVSFWYDVTDDISVHLPPKTLDRAVRAFVLSRLGFLRQKKLVDVPGKASSQANSNLDDDPDNAGLDFPEKVTFESEEEVRSVLPLATMKAIDQHFSLQSFCEEAKKIMMSKWKQDVTIVRSFFKFFFHGDLLCKAVWPGYM